MPDNDEWTLIESLVTVLNPFQKATEMMSTAKYPSLSTIQPLLYMLVNQTLATADDDSRAILSVKKAIKDDLICRYTSPQLKGLLDLSTYLDPRYKQLPFYSTSTIADIEEKLHIELSNYQQNEDTSISSATNETGDGSEPPTKKHKGPVESLFGSMFKKDGTSQDIQSHDKILREIAVYKTETPDELDSNPLVWWKNRQHLYPIISQQVKKYFSLTGTSVPSERLFSTAGNVISSKRNCLTPENADKLIFLFENDDRYSSSVINYIFFIIHCTHSFHLCSLPFIW